MNQLNFDGIGLVTAMSFVSVCIQSIEHHPMYVLHMSKMRTCVYLCVIFQTESDTINTYSNWVRAIADITRAPTTPPSALPTCTTSVHWKTVSACSETQKDKHNAIANATVEHIHDIYINKFPFDSLRRTSTLHHHHHCPPAARSTKTRTLLYHISYIIKYHMWTAIQLCTDKHIRGVSVLCIIVVLHT